MRFVTPVEIETEADDREQLAELARGALGELRPRDIVERDGGARYSLVDKCAACGKQIRNEPGRQAKS